MQNNLNRISASLASLALAALVVGCASPKHKAPVEDRPVGAQTRPATPAPASSTPAAPEVKPLPGAENAGKPGYYTVKQGDTLIRIALDNGQNWRDLVKWNELENANRIEVGQVLRVVTPGVDAGAVNARPVASAKVESRPLDSKPGTPATGASAPQSPAASAPVTAPPAPTAAANGDDDLPWGWPTGGSVTAGFDEVKNKGLSFGGKAGDPVLAAADGRVVYAGSGLRGYGNLVIIKHNATYLTAYAHNQTLLVKEDQAVRKGQKIAEMGSSDADQVKLHFEVRKQGKPIDPARLLPSR
ncbi:peptidoglycan DD-metalloendopeptidase family protein [Roseateles sp. DAIF2]|uniref:peptidoglycan DD-metalloendopeptidase family protein n=1 Tax=Roseateles sp. DAIF2 TaxID=2714952 RepID=UPI0018A2B7E8|nr:peptidoglycan DD-metalloendopeptidase family protein [Roseateles sp. DAIF2]QPF74462.1 peptidoglycan DD-metalloendopeptidase family protein [Roseateles sp. DAIF2]